MPEERFDEKSEPATPRRRQEARERGHICKSTDLNGAVILLAVLIILNMYGGTMMRDLCNMTRSIFQDMAHMDLTMENVSGQGLAGMLAVAKIMAPLMIGVFVVAFVINVVQVGFIFTSQPLEPDLSKIDPISGMGRMFSMRSAARLLESMLKLVTLAIVLYVTLKGEVNNILLLPDMEVDEIAEYIMHVSFILAIRAAVAMLILGILDYGYQRWQYERDLRMSRDEIKEEMKRLEGDPRTRERRRAIQRQLAMQRMMAAVPKATVVITNPTHLSVALQYDDAKMPAPKIIAKGADDVAMRIREIAREHGIPVKEDVWLARELYKLDLGDYIPENLFEAVALVLATIYQADREGLSHLRPRPQEALGVT
jgi:flagellar biosynthetic protein FlhB